MHICVAYQIHIFVFHTSQLLTIICGVLGGEYIKLYLFSRDNGGDSDASNSHSENWPTPCKALDTSMARSESIYTTWSKLRKRSSALQLRRHASGNNNTATPLCMEGAPTALKSQSLPNLSRRQMSAMTTSETRCVKIYDTQSLLSDTNSSMSCGSKKNNLSLIKLFMKQKSSSNEGKVLTLVGWIVIECAFSFRRYERSLSNCA